jgi:hypothetical protein
MEPMGWLKECGDTVKSAWLKERAILSPRKSNDESISKVAV